MKHTNNAHPTILPPTLPNDASSPSTSTANKPPPHETFIYYTYNSLIHSTPPNTPPPPPPSPSSAKQTQGTTPLNIIGHLHHLVGQGHHDSGLDVKKANTPLPSTHLKRPPVHQESLFEGDHGDRTQLLDESAEDYGYGLDLQDDRDADSVYDSTWISNEDNSTDDGMTDTSVKSNIKSEIEPPSKRPLKQYFLNGELC